MSEAIAVSTPSRTREWDARLRLPENGERMPQDAEWCEIRENGHWRRLRFHDYHEIYERPGLYEYLFYELLECQSPRRVVGLLGEVRTDLMPDEPLRVIDLGAGNGLVGQELRAIGAREVVGIDIIEEARVAAERDLPEVYDDYLVADMTAPDEQARRRLRALRPNALTCVAALGFGDIPPAAYRNAANFVAPGGLLAFNIKAEFLDARYTHGFSEMMRRMVNDGVVRLEATRRYRHRRSAAGDPIYYTAMVATKLRDIPESFLVEEKK
jgi:predicted TPR repeat methyltransferase